METTIQPIKKRTNHKWRLSEVNFIKNNFQKMSNQSLADALGLEKKKVIACLDILKLKRIQLIISPKKTSWSVEDQQYLIDNYFRFDAEFISRKLNRTTTAIWAKANQLKLSKNKKNGKV